MKSDYIFFKSQLLTSFAASVRREVSHQYILGFVAAFRQQYIFAAVPHSGYNCNNTLYSMKGITTNSQKWGLASFNYSNLIAKKGQPCGYNAR